MSGGAGEGQLLVEVVFFFLYDIGRSVDLKQVAAIVPSHSDIIGIVKRRDTPASLQLPKPLVLRLGDADCSDLGGFECFAAQAKVYEDGALSLVVRVRARLAFEELAVVHRREIIEGGRPVTIHGWAEGTFRRISEAIAPAIAGAFELDNCERETYTAYCVLECPEPPADFLARRRAVAANLLTGEEPGAPLHESQVADTLERSFSYRPDDLAVFDLDRCLIFDPRGDYEDLLLIAEHANYQLLELRGLDRLLDARLDEAEDDMRSLYSRSGRRRGGRERRRNTAKGRKSFTPEQRFARIQALRFDALFVLENLENSAKIIGDYSLGEIYGHLCGIFNTEGWQRSVERRLGVLQDIYDMMKTDANDRKLLVLEVIFIVVCIVFPIIQILQVFLLP